MPLSPYLAPNSMQTLARKLSHVASTASLDRSSDLTDLDQLEEQAVALRVALIGRVKDRGFSLLFGLISNKQRQVVTGAELLEACRSTFPVITVAQSHLLCIRLLAASLLQPVSDAGEYLNIDSDSDSDNSDDDSDDGDRHLFRSHPGFMLSPSAGVKNRRMRPSTAARANAKPKSAESDSDEDSANQGHGLDASASVLLRGHHTAAMVFCGESETYRFLCDESVRPWNMVRGCLLPVCAPVALSISVLQAALKLRALHPVLRRLKGWQRLTGWDPAVRPSANDDWAHLRQSPAMANQAAEVQAALSTLAHFEAAVRQLQRVRLHALAPAQRQVFFLNVYNAMVEHGLLRLSVPIVYEDLESFRRSVTYRIGRMDFTLDDILHVVFRGNKPYRSWTPPVSASDPRAAFSAPTVDPRLLVLRTDAVLPPPCVQDVPTLNARGVGTQLDDAATAFCAQHVRVDERRRKLFLPAVFQIYRHAWPPTISGLVEWLGLYVPALRDAVPEEWTVLY